MPRDAPPGGAGPLDQRLLTVQRDGGARATSCGWEDGGNEREGRPTAPQPTNRRLLTRTAAPSTHRPSPPPRPAGAARRQRGEQGA